MSAHVLWNLLNELTNSVDPVLSGSTLFASGAV